MYNWNAHMRGAGFPLHPQQLMPISGPHLSQMPFQPPPHQWAQQHQGMGMMMRQGWPPTAQPPMFPQHGMLPGLMPLPVTAMMGPAPPSQPPPPLPAEPPPPPHSTPKIQPPTPIKEASTAPQSGQKSSKWDQPNAEPSGSVESAAASVQSRPPQSPAAGQPRPPQSPAAGQPRPPQSPAAGQPRPPQSPATGQPRPPQSPAAGQPRPSQSPAAGQPRPPQSPGPGQSGSLPSSAPGQPKPYIPPGQPRPPMSPAPPSQRMPPQGLAPNQDVSLRVPTNQPMPPQGPTPSQPVPPQCPPPSQSLPLQGQIASQTRPTYTAAPGQTAHQLGPVQPEKTAPDPMLVAELENVKMEEALFLEQYKQWKKQYDDWREQNQNHPNKEQFGQYLEQWKTYEQQMEVRRNGIQIQKQSIEDKLAAAASHFGQARLATTEDISGARPSKSRWDMAGQPTGVPGDSATSSPQRFDSSSNSVGMVLARTFYSSGLVQKPTPALHSHGTCAVEEEKGEEDMNLDDDEESGGGGIIEGGGAGILESGSRSVESVQPGDQIVWQEKLTTESSSQPPSEDWIQGQDSRARPQWGPHGGAEPTRAAAWSEQRGGPKRFEEPGNTSGGGWDSANPDPRSTFSNAGLGVDSDFRLTRPASGGFGQPDGEYTERGHQEFDNTVAADVDTFQNTSSRGRGIQRHAASGSNFQPGRGGPFLMGRGEAFQRGDFPMGGEDFHRDAEEDDLYRGRVGGLPLGRGGDFQIGRGSDLHRGRRGDFQIGRGSDLQRGRGSDLHRGRGGDFQIERGSDLDRGRGGDFQRGRGSDFQKGRGGDFQRGWGDDFQYEDGEEMLNNSLAAGNFERDGASMRGRGGFLPRGRGAMPSISSFDFNVSSRHTFSDFDPASRETRRLDIDSQTVGEEIGQGHARAREAQRFSGEDDEHDSSDLCHLPGRGIGVGGHGEAGRAGSQGFISQLQGDFGLGQRGRGSLGGRGGPFTDIRRLGSGVSRGQHEIHSMCEDDKFLKSGEFVLRDGVPGSMRCQVVKSDRSFNAVRSVNENAWDDQLEEKAARGYDLPHGQLNCNPALVNGPSADRDRSRSVPDEDEPHVKKGRLSQELEPGTLSLLAGDKGRLSLLAGDKGRLSLLAGDKGRLSQELEPGRLSLQAGDKGRQANQLVNPYPGDPYQGDPFRGASDRNSHLDTYAGRPQYGYDRPPFDRFGPKSSVYEPLVERKPRLPAESIDYGHGGVDRQRKVHQPAEVIDYGHGQCHEGQAAELSVYKESLSHGANADRTNTFIFKGGAQMRAGREGHELTRLPEFRDRETSARDAGVRGAGVPSRFSTADDVFAVGKVYGGASAEPKNFKGWLGDCDENLDADYRVPSRDRTSMREEEGHDLPRGLRMDRFASRDEGFKSGSDLLKVFASREDDRPTFRDSGGPDAGRVSQDYSDIDDYYVRRDDMYDSRLSDPYLARSSDYPQQRNAGPAGDGYLAISRDSRYGSSSGGDIYSRAGGHAPDREEYSRAVSPPTRTTTPSRPSTVSPPQTRAEVIKVEDLLCPPNRANRPAQIVAIIRGLPGSGKTYTSKLLREKEISCGGAAPRMLCLDDYFMVETEREMADQDTGRKIKKKVMEYEYEQALEENYRQSLLKSFKKTVDDGFFPFIIVDATNERVVHFSEFWSYAKSKGFQVYVGELSADVPTCIQRNIHHWTEWDIEKVKNHWEPLPSHYIKLDLRWLLQEDSIPEVIMEDTQVDDDEEDKNVEEEDEELNEVHKMSRWELDTSEETLDKLDGIRVSKKHIAEHQSLNDYLQLDQMDEDYFSRESVPGKKRVRWADLEEKKNQSRRRNLGFVVGQTQQDWERITDDDFASKALNQTKYFYKN